MPHISLVDARGLLGWSQAKLADEAGVKKTAVSDIESGRTPNPGYQNVLRLVRALQRGGMPGLKTEDVFPLPDADDVVRDVAVSA